MSKLISKDDFIKLFDNYDITISDSDYSRFEAYADLLCEWNEKINLTAITDPEGISIKHFFDSVYPFTLFEVKENATVIDVGTGAGFPSCPLKIFRDDIKLTLLDSLNKRINFLAQLSDSLDRSMECREQFDIATARAVANLSDLCEYCLPFVKVGGYFVALKGSGGNDELKEAKNAIKILGGKVEEVFDYELPTGDGRTLILIRKVSETPEKYPRNKGQMKKKKL